MHKLELPRETAAAKKYATAIHSQFGRFPRQVVLYVGGAPLRMPDSVAGPRLQFSCKMVDIRELDGEALIAGSQVEDNVICGAREAG